MVCVQLGELLTSLERIISSSTSKSRWPGQRGVGTLRSQKIMITNPA